MRETLLGKLVLVLSRATPEELAAVYQFATREPFESAECGMRSAEWKPGRADGCSRAGAKGGSPYVFRWTGRDWEVIFGGGKPFYLEDTLGARYLNYLLHHPNEPISAFDLEVAIMPEKGEARARDSIQPGSDARALGEYREELRRLRTERQQAEAAGEQGELEHLDCEAAALELGLKGGRGRADTGERAFDNVRKALRLVFCDLGKGGVEAQAFEQHLRNCLEIGFQCLYHHPEGRIWK
jgi:hypothetical protein